MLEILKNTLSETPASWGPISLAGPWPQAH